VEAVLIAVDTNLLVYAHRPECPGHSQAKTCLTDLAEGAGRWGIPQHCLIEFVGVVTNPRIWAAPSSNEACLDQVDAWLESPTAEVLEEGPGFWSTFSGVVKQAGVRGGAVHDARIAACCREHGVRELLTCDRDFSRYPWLKVRNPLVADPLR
jgi:hypothetical protein